MTQTNEGTAKARAVVWTDHHEARVLSFDKDGFDVRKVHAHTHSTRQHHSDVRTEHEFFAAVCDALDGTAQALVTGPQTSIDDLRHYAKKHRPQTAARVVGYERVDHPSDNELVAFAREFFIRLDRMSGVPTPS